MSDNHRRDWLMDDNEYEYYDLPSVAKTAATIVGAIVVMMGVIISYVLWWPE